MPDKQIFFDPQRKRWKRLRRFLDATAVISTLVMVAFIFNVLRNQHLPELLLPTPKHNYKALPDRNLLLRAPRPVPPTVKPPANPPISPSTPAKGCAPPITSWTTRPATPPSRSMCTRSICCFPSGCTSSSPDGTLMALTEDDREYPVIDGAAVHDPDQMNKIKRVIQAAKVDTEIFPHLNNFNCDTQYLGSSIGAVLTDAGKRAALRQQIIRFFTAFPGLSRPLAGH